MDTDSTYCSGVSPENVQKNREKFCFAHMEKPGIYVKQHVKPYVCTKFGDSHLKNEPRNGKIDQLIKWSVMRISNEAESPYSNLSEILGQ